LQEDDKPYNAIIAVEEPGLFYLKIKFRNELQKFNSNKLHDVNFKMKFEVNPKELCNQ